MSSLDALMYDEGPSINYNEKFMQVIEDHLTYIRAHRTTELIEVENEIAHKSDGSLTSLLHELNVNPAMHWVIMRINGYESPMQYNSTDTELLIPSASVINDLLSKHRVAQSQ